MKRLLLLSVPVLMASAVFAQLTTVNGTVLDVNNIPVNNQAVFISSDSMNNNPFILGAYAYTDSFGHYSYSVPSGWNIPNGTAVYTSLYACGAYQHHTNAVSGATITSNFVICAPPAPTYKIKGNVTYSPDSIGMDSGIVYIIRTHYDSVVTNSWILTLVDSVPTDIVGNYSATLTTPGQYLVKAAMTPYSAGYSTNLPTYYTGAPSFSGSLNWSGATPVNLTGVSNNVNIQLIGGTNPGGPGFVGGSVLLGANKTTAVGDPLSNRELLLTDMNNNAVAYTYSDANGKFMLSDLPYGSYKLFGDRMGLQNPALMVTLDANNKGFTNIVFSENSTSFTGSYLPAASVKELSANLQQVKAYPNPVANTLNVSGLDRIEGAKTLQITNLNGQVMYSEVVNGKGIVTINTGSLASGLYLLQIQTSEGTSYLKVTRQ
jgi:hypothetical protein